MSSKRVLVTGFGVLGGQEVGEQLVEKMAGRLDTMLEDHGLPLEREPKNTKPKEANGMRISPEKKSAAKLVVERYDEMFILFLR